MKKNIYRKLISAAIGLTAFLLAFAATVAIPQLFNHGSPNAGDALPAFAEVVAPEETPAAIAREIYTVKSKGGVLVVCDEFGTVIDTYPLPTDLPPGEKASLQQGITVFGKEALLKLLEDYSE